MKKLIGVFFSIVMMLLSVTAVFASDEGWNYSGRGWSYRNVDGSTPVNSWLEIDGQWYRFDETGIIKTGMIPESNGFTYYCYGNGVMAVGWVCHNDSWYFFDNNGRMQTGWLGYGDSWYFFNDDGKMATGWVLYDDYWYYFSEEGKMVTGWQNIDGVDYYFSLNGKKSPQTYVQQLAWETLDRVGWDLYSAFEWSVGMAYDINLDLGYQNAYTASYSFTTYYGNCVSMASTFYWMAKELGFEAYVIEGWVPYRRGGYGEHAWVEIVIDGEHWVCDPDFEMQEGRNGYFIYYGQSGTWRYEYGYILSDY